MGVDPDRHQIHAVRPEGATAQQASGAQGQAAPETVDREGFYRVGGAARIEAAGRDPAGGRTLVGGHQGHRHPDGEAPRGVGAAHAGTWACPAFTRAVATSSRNTEGASSAAAGSSHTRYVPRARVGAADRTTSRARRRSELRTTAPPQRRPIAYATCGNTPGSPISARTNVARTGPLAPRARERCSSANAARRVMRPTVRTGTRGLQTVRRWRPLSRREFRMARPARVDMRLRNPWVRALFRVFGW